ncbi:MAG TPA: plastocyanin/azurin family copper-binding protein [Solirubrobacteraceae bacterium]|jgi:plastocyanin|nr:plastocyanin/azurin family copper-binding protein [Solirubrobacteraceae bacterium]
MSVAAIGSFSRRGGALVGAGLALFGAASGCSGVKHTNANLIEGKQAFVAKCGACHTLARANTKGVVGPNLDEAFRYDVAEGLRRSAIRSVVEGQVENPNRYGVMPSGLAEGATLNNIAAYVAEAVARPGTDSGLLASAVKAPGAGKPAVETGGKLEIPADPTGQLAYAANKASASAGSVSILMPNMSGVSHNIAIEAGAHEATGAGPVIAASSFVTKGTTSIKVTLKPGTYTFFCQAPGHRAAGMFGTITVK